MSTDRWSHKARGRRRGPGIGGRFGHRRNLLFEGSLFWGRGGNDRVRRRSRREAWVYDGVIATRNRKRFRTQRAHNRGAHCGIGQFHTLETMRTNLPNQGTLPNARDNGTGSVYGEADLSEGNPQFALPTTHCEFP